MREKTLDFGTVEKLGKVPGLTSLRTVSPIFKIGITKETAIHLTTHPKQDKKLTQIKRTNKTKKAKTMTKQNLGWWPMLGIAALGRWRQVGRSPKITGRAT